MDHSMEMMNDDLDTTTENDVQREEKCDQTKIKPESYAGWDVLVTTEPSSSHEEANKNWHDEYYDEHIKSENDDIGVSRSCDVKEDNIDEFCIIDSSKSKGDEDSDELRYCNNQEGESIIVSVGSSSSSDNDDVEIVECFDDDDNDSKKSSAQSRKNSKGAIVTNPGVQRDKDNGNQIDMDYSFNISKRSHTGEMFFSRWNNLKGQKRINPSICCVQDDIAPHIYRDALTYPYEHTQKYRFCCTYCDKSKGNVVSLIQHIASIHYPFIIRYGCRLCKEGTDTNQNWKRKEVWSHHMRKVHGIIAKEENMLPNFFVTYNWQYVPPRALPGGPHGPFPFHPLVWMDYYYLINKKTPLPIPDHAVKIESLKDLENFVIRFPVQSIAGAIKPHKTNDLHWLEQVAEQMSAPPSEDTFDFNQTAYSSPTMNHNREPSYSQNVIQSRQKRSATLSETNAIAEIVNETSNPSNISGTTSQVERSDLSSTESINAQATAFNCINLVSPLAAWQHGEEKMSEAINDSQWPPFTLESAHATLDNTKKRRTSLELARRHLDQILMVNEEILFSMSNQKGFLQGRENEAQARQGQPVDFQALDELQKTADDLTKQNNQLKQELKSARSSIDYLEASSSSMANCSSSTSVHSSKQDLLNAQNIGNVFMAHFLNTVARYPTLEQQWQVIAECGNELRQLGTSNWSDVFPARPNAPLDPTQAMMNLLMEIRTAASSGTESQSALSLKPTLTQPCSPVMRSNVFNTGPSATGGALTPTTVAPQSMPSVQPQGGPIPNNETAPVIYL